MLGRLIAWFRARWQRRERAIFAYWNGRRVVKCDPLLAWYGMLDDAEFNLDRHPAAIDRGDREAIQIATAMVRRVFGIKSLASGGLTEQECLALFVEFLAYWSGLKKSTDDSLTSLSPSVPAQPDESTTRPAADLSSTSDVPSCDGPPG